FTIRPWPKALAPLRAPRQEFALAEIRNPSQSGGGVGVSRTLLVFPVFFVLIFLGLQYFSPKKKPQPENPPAAASSPAAKVEGTPSSAGPATASPSPADAVVAAAESTTVVEN